MKKLLWIGDAVAPTGFARITHQVLDVVRREWEVHVLGLNYLGDPHPYPYSIYPSWPGGDAFGTRRVKSLLDGINPDLIVIQQDPWNIPGYMSHIGDRVPVVAALAIDGKNCRASEYLKGVRHCIFWTDFGRLEAQRGGWTGPSSVIPLGVDLELYKPIDRLEARKQLGLPEFLHEAFIVGNINRNQPRKRLDLCVQYFAEWIQRYAIKDAFLFLQLCPTGDLGYDVRQLKDYYDPGGRPWLIFVEPNIGIGVDERMLPFVYSSFDIQMTTTQGEGWGLTTMEGMACGIPQLVPIWSALGEWAGAALGAKCSSTAVTPNKSNTIGGVPDREQMIAGLQRLYTSRAAREQCSHDGLFLVKQEQFRWPNIGARYLEVLNGIPLTREAGVPQEVAATP